MDRLASVGQLFQYYITETEESRQSIERYAVVGHLPPLRCKLGRV